MSETTQFMKDWKLQKKSDEKFRALGGEESGNGWSFISGDYSVPIFPTDFGTPAAYGFEHVRRAEETLFEPLGIEHTISTAIDALLESSQKRPLVILDFGGGLGTSWCRLASHFESQVKAGELIFIVTNMEKEFDPKTVIKNRVSEYDPNIQVLEHALSNNLVQYVEGELTGASTEDIKSLRQTTVTSQGSSIPTYANCDVIHTRMSLRHSKVPEIHYPRLMDLLSKQGIFIDSTFSSKTRAIPAHTLATEDELSLSEKKRIAETYAYCQETFQLSPVTEVEVGAHKGKDLCITVLRKSDSPVKIGG